MVATRTTYAVRPMQRADIPVVSAIDREAFPTQWPAPPFKRDLDNRLVHYLVAIEQPDPEEADAVTDELEATSHTFLSRVLERLGITRSAGGRSDAAPPPDSIVGYAALWQMVDEAHLTSIAVKESHRRKGIGELLLACALDLAVQLRSNVMTLETRVSNSPARALYTKYGFSITGIRRGYYSDDGEDAVIMTTDTLAAEEYRSMLGRLKLTYLERWGAPGTIRLR